MTELNSSQRFRASIGFAAPDLEMAEQRVKDMRRSWAARRVMELPDKVWDELWPGLERILSQDR